MKDLLLLLIRLEPELGNLLFELIFNAFDFSIDIKLDFFFDLDFDRLLK
jgi:hypothetical protein